MSCNSIVFTAPGQVDVREEPIPVPQTGQVLVKTLLSAISSGTELMVYRGQFPGDIPIDDNFPGMGSKISYPVRYGYSAVGRIIQVGEGVDPACMGQVVFAFKAHTSHFLAGAEELMPVPGDISPEDAAFLPNMETAVNLVMDGAPLIGERVAVFGQGIVGLLTTALLSRFPLGVLNTLDCYELRRKASLSLGAHASLDPNEPQAGHELQQLLSGGADLAYEVSGAPAALDQAIAATGFAGRVVVGSWYGQKRTSLDLGGRFHRSRIRLISSQVSTLAPELSGRWSKARRFSLAWEMLRQVQPARLITHRFAAEHAHQAYQLLDAFPSRALQVVLNYTV